MLRRIAFALALCGLTTAARADDIPAATVEAPVDASVEAPVETSVETSVEAAVEAAVETSVEAPAPASTPPEPAVELAETHTRFVVGRYDLIGRHPDDGKPYSGRATIAIVGGHLRLTREIDGWRGDVFGTVRSATPGESMVLGFAWGEQPVMEMVCLIGSDLDNYPRLTCHWGRNGNPHKKPGIEAYFSREPWEPVE